MRSTLEPFERTIKKALSAEVIDIWDVALTNVTSSSLRLPCTRSRRARSRISSNEATRSLSGSRIPSQMGRQRRTGDHGLTDTVFVSYTRDDVIPHMHALFQGCFEWGPVQKFVG